jgi:ubiquinone biosynthesis protein
VEVRSAPTCILGAVRVLLGFLLFVLFVVVVGKASGRLLGIRLGNARGAVVGTIGWIAGITAVAFTLDDSPRSGLTVHVDNLGQALGAAALVVFFGVLAAMPVAIGIDLLTRGAPVAKRRRGRWWLHPIRSLKAQLAPYGRLREVIGNARRANLLHWRYATGAALDSPDLTHRVRTVLEESGGMMVKLGQIASTRNDVLPAPLTAELSKLRADVRPIPPDDVRGAVEQELGEPVEQAFASFEWEPLAAASIGQTHRAVLRDGTRVVVKVRRPGIEDVVARDASVLRMISDRLERRVEAARSIGLRGLTEELIGGLEEELEFLHEAKVGTALAKNRAADVGISVPRVYTTLSTDGILVMEEVVGRSVGEAEALDASPVPRPLLARRVLASYIGQILDDGLFHADPHPGNMLIDAEGTIWLLDFGSVGRLDARALNGLRGIALGVATNEPGLLARAARDLAGDDGAVDLRALEADMGVALGQLDSPGGMDPRLIRDVLSVMRRHGMRPPSSVTLLARSLLTIEGTLRLIDPGFSLTATSREVVLSDHGDAIGTPQEILQREALRALPSLRTLPEHVETLANQLRSGRLSVQTELFVGESRHAVDNWVDRIVIAATGGLGAIAGAIVLFAASATDDGPAQTTLWILGFAGLTGGSVLLMRAAARALRRTAGRIE